MTQREKIIAVLEGYRPSCSDDRCSCIGSMKWDCILGVTPENLAAEILVALADGEIRDDK